MESNRVFFVFESEFRSFEKQGENDTKVSVWWKWETFVTGNVKSLSTKFCGFFVRLQKCAEKYIVQKTRTFKQCDLVLPPSVCWA